MFAKLKAVRDTLKSVQLVTTEPATVTALLEAIEELDDAMVMDVRAHDTLRLMPATPLLTADDLRRMQP